MKINNIDELIEHQIQDLYDAENQLIEALPKMVDAASSTSLKTAFEKHLEQTREHAQRIEQVASMMGVEAEGVKCKGMVGLILEGEDKTKEVVPGPVLDLALIGGARRVEHYESAAYMGLIAQLETLGEEEVVALLRQTLAEEEETDKSLAELASDEIMPEAATFDEGTEKEVDEMVEEMDDEE